MQMEPSEMQMGPYRLRTANVFDFVKDFSGECGSRGGQVEMILGRRKEGEKGPKRGGGEGVSSL